MRPVHLARLDKIRPVLVLTRTRMLPLLTSVTVAPITTTIRGIPTEVRIGPECGIDHDSVISLDNITTIPTANLLQLVAHLPTDREPELAAAVRAAFDLP